MREIDLGEFRSSEIAYITILGALNFENVVNFSLHKVQKFRNIYVYSNGSILTFEITN